MDHIKGWKSMCNDQLLTGQVNENANGIGKNDQASMG